VTVTVSELHGVIFDVDGTLVDSNEAHVQAWLRAMREQGYEVSYERVRRLVGMGADNLLPNALGISKDDPAGAEINRRQAEIFKQDYLSSIKAFPKACELVSRIRDAGLKRVVATSARPEELKAMLQVAGITDLIEDSTSSGDAPHTKPDPGIVEAALGQSGLAPYEAIMLGDTPYDAQSAGQAGVRLIAVRSGGFSDQDLAGALAIYDDVADLLAHFAESPLGTA
jgi:HAD superfamily hydrolase (TIGR01549 family)